VAGLQKRGQVLDFSRLPESLTIVRRNGKGGSPKFCLVDLL